MERLRQRLLNRGLLLAFVATSCVSCSSGGSVPLHPVRGQILYKGRAVQGAMVVLHPLEQQHAGLPKPLGYTDSEGRFSLTTERPGDGAPSGDYAVTVELRERTRVGAEKVKARNLLPSRYAKPQSSSLRFRVEAGMNEPPPFKLTEK
jgi:hypothetical protein